MKKADELLAEIQKMVYKSSLDEETKEKIILKCMELGLHIDDILSEV